MSLASGRTHDMSVQEPQKLYIGGQTDDTKSRRKSYEEEKNDNDGKPQLPLFLLNNMRKHVNQEK